MITILLPSRGLIFSDTVQALWREIKDFGDADMDLVVITGKPIPEAQNKAVKEALKMPNNWLLFLEEDMILPEGTFKALFKAVNEQKFDIAIINYPVGDHYSTICRKDGQILWFGLGCTLIHRHVFEELGKDNWFETDKSVKINNLATLDYEITDIPAKYGGHDILFGLKVAKRGLNIGEITALQACQYRLVELGRSEYNNGVHKIAKLEGINHFQEY